MTDKGNAVLVGWDSLPLETMRMGITRRFVNSDNIMIAQVNFQKGDLVPAHRHPNEQFTYVLSGALEFRLGEQGEIKVVREGDILFIPADMLHSALALEDTFELDIFNPPRQDWLDGSDQYLRNG